MLSLALSLTQPAIAASSVVTGNTHAYRYYRWLSDAPVPSNGGNGIYEIEIATSAAGADTTTGMTATASSVASTNVASRAIDDNGTTAWLDDQGGSTGQWLKIDYGATAGNWVVAKEVRIAPFGATTWPANHRIQGSDDNSAWTDLLVVTGDTFAASKTFTV